MIGNVDGCGRKKIAENTDGSGRDIHRIGLRHYCRRRRRIIHLKDEAVGTHLRGSSGDEATGATESETQWQISRSNRPCIRKVAADGSEIRSVGCVDVSGAERSDDLNGLRNVNEALARICLWRCVRIADGNGIRVAAPLCGLAADLTNGGVECQAWGQWAVDRPFQRSSAIHGGESI